MRLPFHAQRIFGWRPASRIGRLVYHIGAATSFLILLTCALLSLDGLTDSIVDAKLAIVPGSMVHTDGSLSHNLEGRLEAVLDLYQSRHCQAILVSGGVGKEGRDEAETMKAYLVAHNVPDSVIVVDRNGVNTFATARFAAALIQQRNFGEPMVVSSFFHITRLRLALARQGITMAGHKHARRYELRDGYSVVREVFGLVAYSFK